MKPITIIGLLLWASSAAAATVDFSSGTSGSFRSNQSFNETRAIDVNILGSDLAVSSMTLNEFNISTPGATVGARIYNSDGSLRAAANEGVSTGFDLSLSIPITTILESGSTYRIGFFIDANLSGGSADFFDPDPPGLALTPYTDSTGTVLISGVFQLGGDAFPTNLNSFVPLMTMEVNPVPLPAAAVLFASGIVVLGIFGHRRRPA